MMIFSLVAMTGLEKCCITSAYLQWQCHSDEQPVALGPLVMQLFLKILCGMANSVDPDQTAPSGVV